MMNPYWLLDEFMLSVSERGDDILDAITKSESPYYVTRYERFKNPDIPTELLDISSSALRPGIGYGSIQFVEKLVSSNTNLVPGSYYDHTSYKVSNYLTRINPRHYLNHNGFLLPYKILKENYIQYSEFLKDSKLFIRPDTGKKIFTGCVIDVNDPMEFVRLENSSAIIDNTLVWVSNAKHLSDEYRYIIVNREVVGCSQYHKNGEIHIKEGDNPVTRKLAETVAKQSDENYTTFVCDVGLWHNEPYVVELNCINTSSWYCADVYNIVNKLNAEVTREFNHY